MMSLMPVLKPMAGVACMVLAANAWSAARVPSESGLVLKDMVSPFLYRSSGLAVGNKGEDLVDVSIEALCGEAQWAFDHAELAVTRQRFGAAQFVELPRAGCVSCSPVRVRWYHEPTGHLTFHVNVFRRLAVTRCDAAGVPLSPQPSSAVPSAEEST